MQKEVDLIIHRLEESMSGEPWYGKSVLALLSEIDPGMVYHKPGSQSHSMIELLYHMITWMEFVQQRLQKEQYLNPEDLEALDWRKTNPEIHTWNAGISQLTALSNKIIETLKNSSDGLLDETVDYRPYDFRYLLTGIIQHNIYHIGQIALLNKLLKG
jgi:uncharacterized damage-inducible protein DinB